eukprot:Rmarinus@m.28097
MSDILFQDLNLFRKKYAQLHSYDFDNAVSAMCWGDRACTKVLACSHDLRGKCHEVQLLTVPALCADPDNTVFLNQDVDLDLGGFSDLPVFDVTLVEEGEFPIFATARRLSGTSCQFDLWKLDSDSVLFAPAAALTTPSIPAGQAAMCSSHGRSGGCHVAVAYQETATRCPRLAAKEESLPGLRAPTVEGDTNEGTCAGLDDESSLANGRAFFSLWDASVPARAVSTWEIPAIDGAQGGFPVACCSLDSGSPLLMTALSSGCVHVVDTRTASGVSQSLRLITKPSPAKKGCASVPAPTSEASSLGPEELRVRKRAKLSASVEHEPHGSQQAGATKEPESTYAESGGESGTWRVAAGAGASVRACVRASAGASANARASEGVGVNAGTYADACAGAGAGAGAGA